MMDPIGTWPRQEILLLTAVAQLTLLTLAGWLISRRLARLARFQQKWAQTQAELTRAVATYRAWEEDPHATIRRIATQAIRRPLGELTPIRGSAAPAYLLFREDDTRRRLLLAAGGDLKAALRAEGIQPSPWPWKRPTVRSITPLDRGALVLEEIADVWAALAGRLGLSDVLPSVARWSLVEMPPEEFER